MNTGALRRRYGRAAARPRYGLPEEQRHAYRAILVAMNNNPGQTRWMWRHWMQMDGTHKAVTDRVLSTAERRGHVAVHEGRYYITPKGIDAAWPAGR
jgi:hypothetical protein